MQKVLSNRVRYLVELLVVTMVAGKNIQPRGQLLTTVKHYWMMPQTNYHHLLLLDLIFTTLMEN